MGFISTPGLFYVLVSPLRSKLRHVANEVSPRGVDADRLEQCWSQRASGNKRILR